MIKDYYTERIKNALNRDFRNELSSLYRRVYHFSHKAKIHTRKAEKLYKIRNDKILELAGAYEKLGINKKDALMWAMYRADPELYKEVVTQPV